MGKHDIGSVDDLCGYGCMRFVWGGKPFNPLEEGDELSLAIVKAYLKASEYSFQNGENKLRVSR